MSDSSLPIYLRIAQQLETQILAGVWPQGRLPSLRALAQQHQVSVITMSRAVQVLRERGYVQRTDHSGCYLGSPVEKRTYALCMRVTPGPWHRQSGEVLLRGFQLLQEQGEAHFVQPFRLDADPVPQLREWRDQIHGLFMLPSRVSPEWAAEDERFLAACKEAQLPVVLLERRLRGRYRDQEHDLVTVDDFHGAVCLTRHLLETGRRRIGMVVGGLTSSHEAREAGYLHALRNLSPTPIDPVVLFLDPSANGKQADRWLADQVEAHQLDAVFCYIDPVAVGLIVELLSRGIVVPRQVAVCGFEDLPIGDLFTLGVTTYAYPSADMARMALYLLQLRQKLPSLTPITVTLRGRLIIRESTGIVS
ncbi:MAG: substrate-binding domain-containing protein [Gemmataceae bacterium]